MLSHLRLIVIIEGGALKETDECTGCFVHVDLSTGV
jgi:hypothetical protein